VRTLARRIKRNVTPGGLYLTILATLLTADIALYATGYQTEANGAWLAYAALMLGYILGQEDGKRHALQARKRHVAKRLRARQQRRAADTSSTRR
jgi:hypothetical protein